MPWHSLVLGNDAHLEKTEVVFWVGDEGCSCSARRIDLVSQNRAIKYNFTQWHWHRIRGMEFIKLFPVQPNRGWTPIPVLAHQNTLSTSHSFEGLAVWLNGEPRSTCLHKEEIRRGRKVIKEREIPHSAQHPWTDNGWRWRSRLDNAADLSHSATFAPPFTSLSLHHFSVFSCQINRSRIERLTWNYLEK